MTRENSMREEFEDWALSEEFIKPDLLRAEDQEEYENIYMRALYRGWQAARASQQAGPQWVEVTHKEWNIPHFNQPVLLCLNGVVQTDVWEIDQADSDYGTAPYFWFRNDCDECPQVKEGDRWMSIDSLRSLLPKSPDQAQPEGGA